MSEQEKDYIDNEEIDNNSVDEIESEEELEDEINEEYDDKEAVEHESEYEDIEDDSELVVRYVDDGGKEVEEVIRYDDLPNLVRAFNMMVKERQQVQNVAQQLNVYSSILNLVASDPVLTQIVELRAKNKPMDEIINTLQNMDINDSNYVEHESEPDDEIQQKLNAIEQFMQQQTIEKTRAANYEKLVNTLSSKYEIDPENLDKVVETAREITQEMIKELYPQADPTSFFDLYNVPQKFIEVMWEETRRRLPNAIRRKQPANKQNREEPQNVLRKKPPSQIPSSGGVSMTRMQQEGMQNKPLTASERRERLHQLLYGK